MLSTRAGRPTDPVKRAADVMLCFAALVILSPLLVAIAVAIAVESRGGVIFRQERVGRGGRSFRILKFRTMRSDAEARGPQVTSAADARITRVGRILRDWKLDELPQLLNVVRGDMSIVGPRPEVPRYVAHYAPDDRAMVLSVRPGLTDPAALEIFDEAEILAAADDPEAAYIHDVLPRKIRLYRAYVESRSLRGDLQLIWRTLTSVLGRRWVTVPPSRGS